MTEQEAIGVMMTEKHCVERNIKHECDRDCVKCDLLMKDNDVLNGYDMAIKTLEEVQQYLAIGTVEECRAAVEKQIPKKPNIEGDGYADGQLVYDTWICPCCEKHFEIDYDSYEYCPNCGQHIDRSEIN